MAAVITSRDYARRPDAKAAKAIEREAAAERARLFHNEALAYFREVGVLHGEKGVRYYVVSDGKMIEDRTPHGAARKGLLAQLKRAHGGAKGLWETNEIGQVWHTWADWEAKRLGYEGAFRYSYALALMTERGWEVRRGLWIHHS